MGPASDGGRAGDSREKAPASTPWDRMSTGAPTPTLPRKGGGRSCGFRIAPLSLPLGSALRVVLNRAIALSGRWEGCHSCLFDDSSCGRPSPGCSYGPLRWCSGRRRRPDPHHNRRSRWHRRILQRQRRQGVSQPRNPRVRRTPHRRQRPLGHPLHDPAQPHRQRRGPRRQRRPHQRQRPHPHRGRPRHLRRHQLRHRLQRQRRLRSCQPSAMFS
jgi:hypothetical protein